MVFLSWYFLRCADEATVLAGWSTRLKGPCFHCLISLLPTLKDITPHGHWSLKLGVHCSPLSTCKDCVVNFSLVSAFSCFFFKMINCLKCAFGSTPQQQEKMQISHFYYSSMITIKHLLTPIQISQNEQIFCCPYKLIRFSFSLMCDFFWNTNPLQYASVLFLHMTQIHCHTTEYWGFTVILHAGQKWDTWAAQKHNASGHSCHQHRAIKTLPDIFMSCLIMVNTYTHFPNSLTQLALLLIIFSQTIQNIALNVQSQPTSTCRPPLIDVEPLSVSTLSIASEHLVIIIGTAAHTEMQKCVCGRLCCQMFYLVGLFILNSYSLKSSSFPLIWI